MACAQATPLDDALRPAGAARFKADDVKAQRLARMCGLDRLVGDGTGLGDAGHARHGVAGIGGDA